MARKESKAGRSPYAGLQERVRDIDLPPIETVENKYADRDYTVRLEAPEFNSVCPKTGLPDFATIRIEYVPDRRLAEMKSFKLYITAYRDVGIFQEHAANRILDDFVRAVAPREASLEAFFHPRGGIHTSIRCAYRRRGRRGRAADPKP
ncbi:MAG: NADPH-dependent 7-cyano-7-deazaguanine reductase QueF [Planctomycetes bacterium]|nr:NADPH-dependent 7-cyano-7-deazaguanine reductase QueF [Planctomycetota bacterium]